MSKRVTAVAGHNTFVCSYIHVISFLLQVDCSLFGIITQVICVPMKFPERKYIQDNCPNLLDFVDRIKSNYWPDWDEQCLL